MLRGWAYIHFKEGVRPIRGVEGACRRPTLVMSSIIGLNAAVWWLWVDATSGSQSQVDAMLRHFSTTHQGVTHHLRLHTLVTSTISHISVIHLAGNMFALALFGHKTLKVLGTGPFIALYVLGGAAASIASVWTRHGRLSSPQAIAQAQDSVMQDWPASSTTYENLLVFTGRGREVEEFRAAPMEDRVRKVTMALLDRPTLGASGSVSAIAAACAMLFPRDKVIFFVRFPLVLKLPVPIAVGLFFISDVIGITRPFSSVDHEAHLGGLACGVAYVTWSWYVAHRYHTRHLGDVPAIARMKKWIRR